MKSNISFRILIFLIFGLLLTSGCKNKLKKINAQKPMKNYKLAMVQMKVEAGKLEENLSRASDRIKEAAGKGAIIALLPEAMDLGWTDPSAKTKSYSIPNGKTCKTLRKIAAENAIYICAGIIEKDGDHTYNAAVIIDTNGEVILHHRKINELDIAHDIYDLGDRINVARTPLGNLGLNICADATAPGNAICTSLGLLGADIILSPCAWAVPPDFDNEATPYGDTWRKVYQPISEQFEIWIIGVSNVGLIEAGPWKEWSCIGSSLVYAPGGKEVLQAPFGQEADTIIYVDIELKDRPAWGTKWHDYWKSRQDQDT